MDCYHPVEITNPGWQKLFYKLEALKKVAELYEADESTLRSIRTYELELELTPMKVLVPCRKCYPCLKKRGREWQGRLLRESLSCFFREKKILFCTFTYSPKYIRQAEKTYRKDVADLMDRLRSKFRRSIRHWFIAELGDRSERFHLHALFFDPPQELAPNSHFHYSKNGALMGSNAILKDRWKKGIVDVGYVKSPGACVYLVDYVNKNSRKHIEEGKRLFKGGIVCSNKLGFMELEPNELDQIRLAVSENRTPSFTINGSTYSYSYSFLQSVLSPLELRYISFNNKIKNYSLGGQFSFKKERFSLYDDYRKKVDSYSVSLSKEVVFTINAMKNFSINFENELF